MSRRYKSHAWHDKADLAYIKAAGKRKALEAKKKREAFARAEIIRSAKAAIDSDICLSIKPSDESYDDVTMAVAKVCYGEP
jgi:hypothetical protein